MSTNADLARVALSLAEGTIGDAVGAEDLLVDAFADVEEAARAHAYLAGFVLVALANCRGETPQEACAYVRRLLG
jgi:hypothetical protein